MTWTIGTIIPISAIILYAGLYLVVTTSKPQTAERLTFRWYIMAMVIWSISAFLVLANIPETTFWFKFMTASALWAIVSNFHFVNHFLKSELIWARYITIYGAITSIISISTDLVIKSAHIEHGSVIYEFGPFLNVLGITYLLLFYIIYILIREYRITENNTHRNRLRYLLLGNFIIISGTFINFTDLGKYPIDIAANGVSAILIAYAILRYQLLDIRLVIRQGMLYSIPTIIIGTTYFLIITLFQRLFDIYSGVSIFLLSFGVAVLTALVVEPLRERAQHIIDRMFFREKYDSGQMLQTLSGNVASILDIYRITNTILVEICSTLHIHKASFFLENERSGKFQLTTQFGQESSQNIEFRKGHPLILWLYSQDEPISRDDLDLLPLFQSLWKSEWQDLDNLEAELFIPIKVHSKLVGLLAVGSKRSEQAFSNDDILTLSTVANQTAVAIENARLYTAEQNRRKEVDTLYKLARQLVASDDLKVILNSIARHAAESIQGVYSRVLIRKENGDFFCRAIHPEYNFAESLRLGKIEPLVSEHYYNRILQHGQPIIINKNDQDLQEEESQALFLNKGNHLCLSPLKGVDEPFGLLILGEIRANERESFNATELQLVSAISDHATSAIQRAILHEQLEENFLQTVVSLANAMDARDSYTGDHSQRMGDLATRVSQAMNLSAAEVDTIYWAAVLHDIGKIGIPDKILKKPGPLTKKEWAVIKEHPLIGAQIVAPVKYLAAVSPIIRSHHEKVDGSGYPDGLDGEVIPLGSRIVSVVDAYVAIRDERVYRKSRTHEEAIAELRRCSGTQFDPDVVDVFCKIITG